MLMVPIKALTLTPLQKAAIVLPVPPLDLHEVALLQLWEKLVIEP